MATADRAVSVALLGNGVIGLSIAVALKRRTPELSVAVIGPAGRPGGASPAAGAMLGCFGELTERSLATPQGRLRFRLAQAASAAWDGWLAALRDLAGPAVPEAAAGTHVFTNAASGAFEDANFARIAGQLNGAPSAPPTAAAMGLETDATHRPMHTLHLPTERRIDARRLLSALEAAAQRLGVEIIDALAAPPRPAGGGFRIAAEPGHPALPLTAERVVIAAGALSHDLLAGVPEVARRVLPLFAGVGHALILDTRPVLADGAGPRGVVRTPNRAFACGLHAVPLADGRLYVGATNFVAPQPHALPWMVDAHFLMDCAMRQIHRDLEGAPVERILTGNRPVSLDTQPLIGATGRPGLFVCTGTYRDGLHLSPVLADLMARAVLGEPPDAGPAAEALDLFRPDRAPLPWGTPAEARHYALDNFMADIAEAGVALPPNRWDRRVARGLELQIDEAIAAATGAKPDLVLPPDFLPALVGNDQGMLARLRTAVAALAGRE